MHNSNIEWTDNTFNGWIGCTKVSSACMHCYAEGIAVGKKLVPSWGRGSPRKKTRRANWLKPFRWNESAQKAGIPIKVFCSSMADVFDEEVSDDWRRELFTMIELTQWLDWQILTKRPHLIEAQLRRIGYWDKLPLHNVWFGTTMEDQASFNLRWPELRRIPAKVRFCSYEPALGALEIPEDARGNLHWLIAGGETTPVRNHSRPSDPKWFRGVRDQCDEMGIAFFFKQWGNDLMMEDGTREWHGKTSGDYARLHSLLDDRRHLEFPQIPERVLPITCVGGNAV